MNPLLIGTPAALAAGAGLIAYAAFAPGSRLFGAAVQRTNSAQKLAITFDDGPNPALTPRLLDLLDRYGAHATFFVIGRFARECPDLLRETASRGHVICNHTYTHPNLFWMSPAAIGDELKRCSEAIGEILGEPPQWFRPPYGVRNPWVVKTASTLGMRTVTWTLIPGDWTPQPAERLIARMQPIANRTTRNLASPASPSPGEILCLHDGGHRALNADRTHTLKALEYWLPRWRDLGLQFVTMNEAVPTPAP